MTNEQWTPETEADEKILWTGKPENSVLLDGAVKKKLLLTWLIGGTVILASLFLVVKLMSAYAFMPRLIFFIFISMTPVCIIINTFRDYFGLSNARYAISDRNVFVKTPYMEYKYPLKKGVALRTDRENRAVLVGDAVKVKPSSVRTCMLVNSVRDVDGQTEGVALYNLGRPEQVMELLRAQVG